MIIKYSDVQADDDGGGMVDEHARADAHGAVDINLQLLHHLALPMVHQCGGVQQREHISDATRVQGVKAL